PAQRYLLPLVDIETVDRLRSNPQFMILDARAGERFRGEVEPIHPVAGHIAGAHSAPLGDNLRTDGTFESAAELRAYYDALRGSVAPDHLVASCGSGVTACHTLLALEIAGLPGAALYVGSWSEWCRSDRPRMP